MKKEKKTGQEQILVKHLDEFEMIDVCNFDKSRLRACQKKKIKARREES